MVLLEAKKGQLVEITLINNDSLSNDSYRFGIEAGNKILVVNKLPNGPVVIQRSEQQIAIGKELAEKIEVKLA